MWELGKKEKVLRKRCLQRIQTRIHDHTLFTSRESGEDSLFEGSGQPSVCPSMHSSLLWTREMSITLSCNAQLETALGPCLPLCLSDYAAASKSQIGNTSQGSFRTTAFQHFSSPASWMDIPALVSENFDVAFEGHYVRVLGGCHSRGLLIPLMENKTTTTV